MLCSAYKSNHPPGDLRLIATFAFSFLHIPPVQSLSKSIKACLKPTSIEFSLDKAQPHTVNLWELPQSACNPGPACVASLQASVDSLKPCTLGQLASLNGLCVYLRVNVDGWWYFLLSLPTFAPNSAGIATSTPTILTEGQGLMDGWMESTEVRVIPETQQSSHAHLPHGSCCLL